MPRTRRRARAEDLTESWDDVADSQDETYSEDEQEDAEEDERDRRAARTNGYRDGAQKRRARFSAEPELVMPLSPDAGKPKVRANTPHFRMNQRSMTSDAGDLDMDRNVRAQTPRSRMNQRSMTSDAGSIMRKQSNLRDVAEYDDDDLEGGYLRLAWNRILAPILAYCGDIVGLVLANAKPVIAYGLFTYLIVASLIFGSGFITNSIHNALTPICRIPGVTHFFNPSFCPPSTYDKVQGPAEFDKLVQAQDQFSEVLEASSSGANLPVEMKKSEAGMRDLKLVVQYSNLESKNELVHEFEEFIQGAREASDDLATFNSRIGRAVDRILATNRWTLRIVGGIALDESERSSLSKFVGNYLNIFAPFQPVSLSQDIILDQYLRHTAAVEEQILNLIGEAFVLKGRLDSLDERLGAIEDIAAREGFHTAGDRNKLFSELWTKVGGNRNSVKKMEQHLKLLNDVITYKRAAWAHVNATILKLQAIRANLEDLRERVAMPETVGTDKVPLDIHIETINRGIQRLEDQRESGRSKQDQYFKDLLKKAQEADSRMIGDREL